jgi:hypothetical protein
MLWQDLQELFFISMGPFFYHVFLPVLVAGGVLMAIVNAIVTIFRPSRG